MLAQEPVLMRCTSSVWNGLFRST